ncbi:hypothetical protein D3C78_1915450 [compost metagenome]
MAATCAACAWLSLKILCSWGTSRAVTIRRATARSSREPMTTTEFVRGSALASWISPWPDALPTVPVVPVLPVIPM